MLRTIIVKFIEQARHDGFIRFKDGNRINYCRYNIEKIDFTTALNNLNYNERQFVKDNKKKIINEIKNFDNHNTL
jgi:hypothetical protein